MGAWGNKAWDSDGAADWFANLFTASKLAARVEKTLKKKDIEEYYEDIRAAAYIVVQLGRVYIWPIELLRPHLALAINKLEAIKTLDEFSEGGELVDEIDSEIAILRERLDALPPEEPDAQ